MPSSLLLIDHHQPPLASGDYRIEVRQHVGAWESATLTREFSVRGPRFTLGPQEVHAVFPPQGSLGDHAAIRPHVLLRRSTLPWEHSPDGVVLPKGAEHAPPWLALLLIREDEEHHVRSGGQQSESNAFRVQTGTLADLREAAPQLKSGESAKDPVAYVELDKNFFAGIVPTLHELRLLAHVRRIRSVRLDEDVPGGNGNAAATSSAGNGKPDSDGWTEYAAVLCNRLPKAGSRNTVHLVSVEGRYGTDGSFALPAGADTVRLVCLKSWQFNCTDRTDQGFTGLLKNVDHGSLRVLPRLRNTDAERYLALGAVPVNYVNAEGRAAMAWYRGPFVPREIRDVDSGSVIMPGDARPELIGYDSKLGTEDVSYAAAWELGRLLTLANPTAASSLYNWKRCCYQTCRKRKAQADTAHLPIEPRTPAFDFPRDWFEQLARLKGVPFNYLVPDERMLPPESIRFFRADPFWIKCLLNGAFSAASGTESEIACCAAGANELLAGLTLTLSGFLLRSDVVAGWPNLEIDADGATLGRSDKSRRPLARLEPVRLSKNVLLCLFEGVLQTVDIHLPPEGLHFVHKALELKAFSSSAAFAKEITGSVPKVRFVAHRESL